MNRLDPASDLVAGSEVKSNSSWWVRPWLAAIGLGAFVAAVGGPNTIFSLTLNAYVAVATVASGATGVGLVLWMVWRPFKLPGGLHAGIGFGGTLVVGLVLRLITSSASGLSPIIWGFAGGFMLSAALPPSWWRLAQKH